MTVLFLIMIGGCAFGTVAALVSWNDRIVRRFTATGTVAGGVAGLGLALAVFVGGAPFALTAPALLSVGDGVAFGLDALGAFFPALVGLLAIPCGIYGAGYCAAYEGRCSLRLLGAMQWATRARAVELGSAHAYLTYLVIALLGLLTMLLVRGM